MRVLHLTDRLGPQELAHPHPHRVVPELEVHQPERAAGTGGGTSRFHLCDLVLGGSKRFVAEHGVAGVERAAHMVEMEERR